MDWKNLIITIQNDNTKIEDLNLCYFDFETTGLDENESEIIEIGAKKYIAGSPGGMLDLLVSCKKGIDSESFKIHGITNEMIKNKPSIEESIYSFIQFCSGCVLVAHNAEFDCRFLKKACESIGIKLEIPVVCTWKMAKELLPNIYRKNLESIANHYGIGFQKLHRSYSDILVTEEIFNRMLKEKDTFKTFSDLYKFRVFV